MWYVNFRSWAPQNRKELDRVMEMEVSIPAETLGWTDPRAIHHARIQGNPLFDTATVNWIDSVENKRGEIGNYGAPGVPEYLEVLLDACGRTEATFIIDVDDPELVKFGEDGIHERLTSMLADLLNDRGAWPEDEVAVWERTIKYFDNVFFNSVERACVPGGLAVEIMRQALGFPYAWLGARID